MDAFPKKKLWLAAERESGRLYLYYVVPTEPGQGFRGRYILQYIPRYKVFQVGKKRSVWE